MTFTKGGKEGHLTYKGKNLTSVKQFKYLGVTLQTAGTMFTAHIKDRINAATRAMSDIRHLREMSLQTALKLFQLKIVPVATYGLENICAHLSYRKLVDLDPETSTWLIEVRSLMTSICDDRTVAAGGGPQIAALTATHPQLREATTRHAKERNRDMGRQRLDDPYMTYATQ